MSANISSYSFPQMTDLIKRSFTDWLESLDQTMRNSGFVVTDVMPKHTWDVKRFAERIQRNQYAPTRDEGFVATQAKVQYGYEKDMQIYTVALAVSITKRMRDAWKNQDILDSITSLTEVCPVSMDLDLAHRITFAFDTSYVRSVSWDDRTVDTTVWDGFQLAYAAHTLTGSATTYSTIITWNPQFSKGSLENAEKSFAQESFNNLWEKVLVKPDTIISTDDPNTINQIRELMGANADVVSNNAGTINVYKGKYKHVISGRIATTGAGAVDSTKAKYWALASSKNSDFYLCILNEPYLKTPMDGNNWEEFSSENWNYLTGADYGIAIVTGRWIRVSKWDWS